MDKLHSPAEVADALGVKAQCVRDLALRGELPCVKVGRRVRFTDKDLAAWIEAHRRQGVRS